MKLQVFFLVIIFCIVGIYSALEENAEENKESDSETLSRIKRKAKSSRGKGKGPDPDKFFEKFGYLPKPKPNVQHSPASRKQAIKNFQRMTGLKPTGRLDEKTLDKMAAPRCGMPDMVLMGEVPANIASDPGVAQNFYVPGYKWKKTDLTWRALSYSRDLASGSQRRAFYNAFKFWSDQSPLTFREVGSGEADIEIKFASYEHGDGGGNTFDGQGGVLAHAFYPETGDTHFDESELWTENTDQGTNLEIVAAHEFGHALGLGHSNVEEALMAPYYQGYIPGFQLHSDDIQGIQSLYGSNIQTTTMPPRRTTTRSPVPGPTTTRSPTAKPDTCTTKFDAVFQSGDGKIYVFKYKWVWRLHDWGLDDPSHPILARKVFDRPPINIGAAVYSWRTRYTYFFKGQKIFKFYDLRRVEKKYIRTPGYPVGIQSAFMGSDGKIYLLKGDKYWIFNEYSMTVESTEGQPIASKWPGVPPNIEAVVRLRDGYIYFFKGSKYRKFDERYNSIVSGYPKVKAAAWMGPVCGGRYVPK